MPRLTRQPEHPGLLLRRMLEDDLAVTQEGFAKSIGVSRRSLGSFLRGRVPLSLDLALRLERALGEPAESWVERQLAWSRVREGRHDWIVMHPRLARKRSSPETQPPSSTEKASGA